MLLDFFSWLFSSVFTYTTLPRCRLFLYLRNGIHPGAKLQEKKLKQKKKILRITSQFGVAIFLLLLGPVCFLSF